MVRYRGLEPRAARVSDEYSIPTELIAQIAVFFVATTTYARL